MRLRKLLWSQVSSHRPEILGDHDHGNLGDIAVAYNQAGSTTAYAGSDEPKEITDAGDLETLKVASFLAE
jgi:hypothetical protein